MSSCASMSLRFTTFSEEMLPVPAGRHPSWTEEPEWLPVVSKRDIKALEVARRTGLFHLYEIHETDDGLPFVIVAAKGGHSTHQFAPVMETREWHFIKAKHEVCYSTGKTIAAVCRNMAVSGGLAAVQLACVGVVSWFRKLGGADGTL